MTRVWGVGESGVGIGRLLIRVGESDCVVGGDWNSDGREGNVESGDRNKVGVLSESWRTARKISSLGRKSFSILRR